MNSDQRIRSLDGCRAIAILLVIYSHLQFSKTGSFPDLFDWGTLGVFIFFVISGFLITTILQKELLQARSRSLRNFYIRRVFRIFPPLLFLLVGVGILKKLGLATVSGRAIVFSLSFLRNYYPGPYRILHHLWSLSVEEQFYLVWPFVLSRFSKKFAGKLLVAIIIIVPIVRLGTLLWLGPKLVWHTEQVADGLAYGCLLAIKQKELRASRFYGWLSKSYLSFALPLVLVAAACTYPPILYEGISKSVIFLTVALSIDILILRSTSLPGRILNFPPLVWIGKISYSLYLWQQIFLIVKHGDQPYAWFPLNLALALVCAMISYYLIEGPAIRLGRKIVAGQAHPAILRIFPAAPRLEPS